MIARVTRGDPFAAQGMPIKRKQERVPKNERL